MKSIAFLLLATLGCVVAHETPVVLCGRELANTRVILCYGKEYLTKRGMQHNSLENLLDDNSGRMEWPWSGRLGALSANWSRYKRTGIVDECCLKPCTAEVILSYC